MITQPVEDRTNFDMRLEYYEGIGELLRAINIFVSTGNYETWWRALSQLVNMHPFLTPEELKNCDEQLLAAQKLLQKLKMSDIGKIGRMQVTFYSIKLHTQLNITTRTVIKGYAKHDMLLPRKSQDIEESDNEIARQMGL